VSDTAALTPVHLTTESLVNPLGIGTATPKLSWQLTSTKRNERQTSYHLRVASRPELITSPDLWDTGIVVSSNSLHIPYAGKPLASGATAYWDVTVWDADGRASVRSDLAAFSVGLLAENDWRAQWIMLDTPLNDRKMLPSPYLRRGFMVDKPVARATLYITARGLFIASLNGNRIGDAILTPDWTDYSKRLQYDTYNVTPFLQQGENALGVILGEGWHSGYMGFLGKRSCYGQRPSLLAQMAIDYADGTTALLVTDTRWKATTGPLLESDLLMGESYDQRLELTGWDRPGYDERAWKPTTAEVAPQPRLEARTTPPVRVVEALPAIRVGQVNETKTIYDLGQNVAGFVRLTVSGAEGTEIQLRYGEKLNNDGTLYTDNLRKALALDTLTLKGGELTWQPSFTNHGFRYVEISGVEPSAISAVTGCVIHSDLAQTGSFDSSNELVNQIWRTILRGQKGNFVSVPTDCPQRDERLGWAGDVLAFGTTACYNMSAQPFFARWLQSMTDGQFPSGAYPDVAPRLVADAEGSPAWGDAGVITTWVQYQFYGDLSLIEQRYDSMFRWMRYLLDSSENDIRVVDNQNNRYGDWLSYNASTPDDVLATALWAWDAKLMANMARLIGQTADYEAFKARFERIKAAFNREFVSADGRVKGETQTVYLLALHVDLLPAELRAQAIQHLVDDIQERGYHLSTGFVGTPLLLPVLASVGHADAAYKLLMQETIPSWGYMIGRGATTIWERWDSINEENEVVDPLKPTFIHWKMGPIAGMNSFNHYGLGSVGQWFYQGIGGINIDPQQPAFEHVIIRPRPGGDLTWADVKYDSIRGPIRSAWKRDGDALTLDVSLPANTSATVYVPSSNGATAPESARRLGSENGYAFFEVGSGDYQFKSRIVAS
jgi:alpha-L-rhamnosidase